MSFPLEIRKLDYTHSGGTKEYHLIAILGAEEGVENSLLIKRFGKVGAWGQMDFTRGTRASILKLYEKTDREKTGRGYNETAPGERRDRVSTAAEMKQALGAVYFKLNDDIDFLIPGLSDEDKRGMATAPVTPATFKPPEPTVEEQVIRNEKWGMF